MNPDRRLRALARANGWEVRCSPLLAAAGRSAPSPPDSEAAQTYLAVRTLSNSATTRSDVLLWPVSDPDCRLGQVGKGKGEVLLALKATAAAPPLSVRRRINIFSRCCKGKSKREKFWDI